MSNQQAMIELIKATSGQANILTIPRPYIEFMGSLDGGLFLSQLIYWSDRGGQGDGWFYKTYLEWEAETTLSKYEVGKQVKILKDKDILETKIKKANGAPTVHYRFSFDEFQNSFVKFLHYGKSINLTMESEETSRSITETTTKTTTDINGSAKNPQKLTRQQRDEISLIGYHPNVDKDSFDQADQAERDNLNAQYTDTERKALNKLGQVIGQSGNIGHIQTADELRAITLIGFDIAKITETDILAIDLTELRALAGLTIRMSEKGNIAAKLKAFRDWWYNTYWLGKDKGQPPTVKMMGSTWGQFEADKVAPPPSTGPTMSEVAKKNYARLRAAAEQTK